MGGVIGGVVALLALLLALLFYRRYRNGKPKQNPVDLLQDNENHDASGSPPFYHPAPFAVPEPSNSRSSFDPFGRPTSMATSSSDWGLSRVGRSSTPETALLSNAPLTGAAVDERKSASGPSALRPVNIIQHDDGGPSDAHLGEPETVELPPAYTNIKRAGMDVAAAAPPEQLSRSA